MQTECLTKTASRSLHIHHPCELRDGGRLADIAPTMLKLLGLPQPEDMDGESIIK